MCGTSLASIVKPSALNGPGASALPEAVTVLLFAGLSGEARQGADTWLRLAQQRGWPMASALAATVASLTALYDGEVGQALAYGQQAMTGGSWISLMATAFMIPALIDRARSTSSRPELPTALAGSRQATGV